MALPKVPNQLALARPLRAINRPMRVSTMSLAGGIALGGAMNRYCRLGQSGAVFGWSDKAKPGDRSLRPSAKASWLHRLGHGLLDVLAPRNAGAQWGRRKLCV